MLKKKKKNLPRFHHPPPVASPSTGLVLRTFRRPPPAKSPPPVSHGTVADLIPPALQPPSCCGHAPSSSCGLAPGLLQRPRAVLLPLPRHRSPPADAPPPTPNRIPCLHHPQDPTPLGGIRRPASMSRRSQARRLPRALDMTPPASPRRRLHRNHTSLRPGSVAQSNLVRACSPSLSARLTAEQILLPKICRRSSGF